MTTPSPVDQMAEAMIAQAESDAALIAPDDKHERQAHLIALLKWHLRQVVIDLETERRSHAATAALYRRAIDPCAWTSRDVDRKADDSIRREAASFARSTGAAAELAKGW